MIDCVGRAGQFHQIAFQFHSDRFNADDPIYLLSLELDVEIRIVILTVGCKDIVAREGKLEDISIEGLEVVVSPCTAELLAVRDPDF